MLCITIVKELVLFEPFHVVMVHFFLTLIMILFDTSYQAGSLLVLCIITVKELV